MALQKANRSSAGETISLGRPGQPTSLNGYLTNVKEVIANETPTKIYTFNSNGKTQQVWGSRDLDDQMENVPVGCLVNIQSTGKRKTPKGAMYTFDVSFDADDTFNGDSDEETDEEYVTSGQLAAAQSKTEALLHKSKKN